MSKLSKSLTEEYKNHVIDVLIELSSQKPISEITIPEIVRRSGQSNKFLYHHFNGRAGLIRAASLRRLRRFDARVQQIDCSDKSFPELYQEVLHLFARRIFGNYRDVNFITGINYFQRGTTNSVVSALFQDGIQHSSNDEIPSMHTQAISYVMLSTLAVVLYMQEDRDFAHSRVERVQRTMTLMVEGYMRRLHGEAPKRRILDRISCVRYPVSFATREINMDLKRQKIRAAAQRCADEIGIWNLRINDLQRRCGLSTKTIYQEYGGKDDIICDLMQDNLARTWQTLAQSVEPKQCYTQNFRRALTEAVRQWGRLKNCNSCVMLFYLLSDGSNSGYLMNHMRYAVGELFSNEQLQWMHLDCESVSYTLWSTVTAVVMFACSDLDFEVRKLEEVVDICTDFLCSGLEWISEQCEQASDFTLQA